MPESKKTLWQVLKFALFSASAGLIQVASFTLFNEVFHWSYWAAYLPSLVLSVLWNFTFNRRYTFRSDANIPRAMALVFLFYVVFTPLSTVGGDALAKLGWNEYLVTALNMIVNFVTEFLYDKLVVFRDSVDTNGLAGSTDASSR